MKITLKYFFILLMAAPLFTACVEDDTPDIGEEGSKLDGINATWRLVEVNQQDDVSFTLETRNISDFLLADGNAPQITFNSADKTYSVDAKGKLNFWGTEGSWTFDDDVAPTNITLSPTGESDILVNLTATIRPVDKFLQIEFSRDCGGTSIITYLYKYERAN